MPDEEQEVQETETEETTPESTEDEVSEEFFPDDEPAEDDGEAEETFDIQDPGSTDEDPDDEDEDEDDEEEVPEEVPDDDESAGEVDPESAGEQVGVSPELSDRAANVGVTGEDQELFASPEALEEYVSRREQQVAADAAGVPAEKEDGQAYTVTLDPELYDEDIINEFSSLAKHLTGEMEQVRATHSQVMSHLDDEQQRAFVARMDARFASAPDELREVFGSGSFDELDPNGSEMKARADVVDIFNTLSEKYPEETEDTAWHRSLSALHGEAMTKTERSKLRSDIRNQRAVANRPTQRDSTGNQTPQESAVAAVAEKMSGF